MVVRVLVTKPLVCMKGGGCRGGSLLRYEVQLGLAAFEFGLALFEE